MQVSALSLTTESPRSPDRRTAPRLELLDQLQGQLVAVKVPLVVRDLSAGGFSIESVVPFPLGARHQFRFTTAGGIEVTVEATVLHSRPSPTDGLTRYITGFAFVHDSSHSTSRDIDTLLDAMTAVLQFD